MSEHFTPFIPPLMTPGNASPNPPTRPPQLPSHPSPNQIPTWAATAQHSAGYPAWTHTPYSTPFLQALPNMTPAAGASAYLPGTYQPIHGPVIPPPPNRDGYTSD